MLLDERIKTLAHNLVNYSCSLKKGENLLIECTEADYQLVACIIREAYAVGAYPFVSLGDSRIKRELLMGMDKQLADKMAGFDKPKFEQMQAYIGIRGGNNAYENSDVPAANMDAYNLYYAHPVHHDIRVKKTKWVILRYPTPGMSAMSGMSTEAFEDMFFDVCNLDYAKMDKAMDPLVELMNRTDKVRIVSPGTDISFSIKGIGAVKCSGHCNIPDGEVYTAPVKDSVNGRITYNVPSVNNGIKFENVSLLFKDGKIVDATANDTEAIGSLLRRRMERQRFRRALGSRLGPNSPDGRRRDLYGRSFGAQRRQVRAARAALSQPRKPQMRAEFAENRAKFIKNAKNSCKKPCLLLN